MPVKSRRQAREAALRALYQIEVGKADLECALEDLEASAGLPPDLIDFAVSVVKGVTSEFAELKGLIESSLLEWDFERLTPVDRALLLIGAYELMRCPVIPPAVSINEAVELAKRYGAAESGSFVNGVLAAVAARSPKAHLLLTNQRGPRWEEPGPVLGEPEVEAVRADAPQIEELVRSATPLPKEAKRR
jgi:N utilization substance protein B